MGVALRQVAAATSSAGGAATFTFQSPPPGLVWTGTVFVSMAPPAASSNVTVGSTSGGQPWGTLLGGAAGQVQAVPGEVIQVISTGLAATTPYLAVLNGQSDSEEDATYIGPFPAPPTSPGSVLAKGTPVVLPSLATPPGVSTTGTWAYGAWVAVGTLPAADTAGYGLTIITFTANTGSLWYQIQLGYGPISPPATLLGEWSQFLASASGPASIIPIAEPISVPGGSKVWAQIAASGGSPTANMSLDFTGN